MRAGRLGRDIPEHIRSHNGPEFNAHELQKWLGKVGVPTSCGSPQFFKPLAYVLPPVPSTRIAVFTVWTVDSQEGQQVTDPTSQVHNPPPQPRVETFFTSIYCL